VIRHLNPDVKGAGARVYMEERYEGDVAKMEMTITSWDPPRRVDFTIEGQGDPSMGFTENGGYVLVEENGHTRVTLSATTIYHGFMLRFLEPWITHMAQQKLEDDLPRLKALVEAVPVTAP
jgi:hypothetical protein